LRWKTGPKGYSVLRKSNFQ